MGVKKSCISCLLMLVSYKAKRPAIIMVGAYENLRLAYASAGAEALPPARSQLPTRKTGILTRGSSRWRRLPGPMLCEPVANAATLTAHSGASVGDFHPLPCETCALDIELLLRCLRNHKQFITDATQCQSFETIAEIPSLETYTSRNSTTPALPSASASSSSGPVGGPTRRFPFHSSIATSTSAVTPRSADGGAL